MLHASLLPRPALLLLLTAATLTACGDATGPSDPIQVTLTSEASSGVITALPEGPRIECPVVLKAAASGKGRAILHDAVYRWYQGIDRITPVDTQPLSHAETGEFFAAGSIAAGESMRADWRFWAGAPFELELELRYTPEGGGRTLAAKTRFACGMKPTGDAPRPTISDVIIEPASGELQAGDTVTVRYTAASTLGLWTTAVVAYGAFDSTQLTVEQGRASMFASARFVVPRSARLGVPIAFAIYAEDAALQVNVQRVEGSLSVIDRTPPVLESATLDGWNRLGGQVAAGDELRLWAAARDNHALGWLVYELGAPANVRDSVPIPTSVSSTTSALVRTQARPEWIGSPVLSVYVRDAAGNVSNTLRSAPDGFRIYPVVNRGTSAVVSLPTGFAGAITDLVHDDQRGQVYLAQSGLRRVTALDVDAMTLAAPIEFPDDIGGVDLSPGGDSLVVAMRQRNALAFVHLGAGSTRSELRLTALDTAGSAMGALPPQPTTVRIAANGKGLVPLTHGTRAGVHLVEVDLATGTHRLRTDAGVRDFGQMGVEGRIGRTADRTRIVMYPPQGCAQSYLAATDAFTPCEQGPVGFLTRMTLDASGRRISYGPMILDAAFDVIAQAPTVNWETPAAALSPDGELAYLPYAAGLVVMRVSDGAFLERIPLPFVANLVSVSSDGSWLLAIRTATPQVVRVRLR